MSVTVKDYKSFEQLASDIESLNDQWKKSAPNVDKEQTFAGIQIRLQFYHSFIINERNYLHEDINKLKDVWSGKVIAERKEALVEQFNEMVRNMVIAIKQDIAALSSSKLEKIGDMLATAPTEEQIRLLSALQMRGDIDPVEVHHILPVFFSNYQSMRVLQAISEQNGISLHLPVQLNCRTMFNTLNEATDYLLKACDELPNEGDNLHIAYHAFYTTNQKEKDKQYDPVYQNYIDLFDNTPQLQEIKTEKKHLSKSEKAQINWYFRDIKTLAPSNPGDDTIILNRVNDVMKNHPEMIDLLRLSEYKAYVTAVETINQEEIDNNQ